MSDPADETRVELVTIVGTAFFHSIARLCEALFRCFESGAVAHLGEPYPRHDENAYCVSIVVLSIAALESAVTRTRYLEEGIDFEVANWKTWLGNEYPAFEETVKELAFVRGSVSHAHLYSMLKISINEDVKVQVIRKRLASGDGKFENLVNTSTYKTNQLGINVIPDQIRVSDVTLILEKINDILLCLEQRTKGQLGFRNARIELNKESGLTLDTLVCRLNDRLKTYESRPAPSS